jgi:Tol biopolymer transport system component
MERLNDIRLVFASMYYLILACCIAGCGGKDKATAPKAVTPLVNKIVFEVSGGGDALYTISPDGTGRALIPNTKLGFGVFSPSISSDGRRIVYAAYSTSFHSQSTTQIRVINVDGTGMVQLTNEPEFKHGEPMWSPDGSRIAFDTNRDGVSQIYVMNADGSSLMRIPTSRAAYAPSWSPDGTEIAFSSESLYVMRVDGSNVRALADSSGEASWSPDGSQLVFSRTDNSADDIWKINADGTSLTRLTTFTGTEWWPSWSRDGTRITFCRVLSGPNGPRTDDIWIMNADGSGQHNLTNTPNGDAEMRSDWSPAK